MNDANVKLTKEFVFQRLSEPFPFSTPETPTWLALLVAGVLLLFAVLSFVVPMIRVVRGAAAGLAVRGLTWAALAFVGVVVWLGLNNVTEDKAVKDQLLLGVIVGQAALALLFGVSALLTLLSNSSQAKGGNSEGVVFGTLLTVLFGRADTGPLSWWHLTAAGCRAMLFLIPLACLGVARGFETDTEPVWYGFTGAMLYTACALTCLMYMKDSGVVSWWGLLFVLLPLPFAGPPVLMLALAALLWAVGHFRKDDLAAWLKVAPMALVRTLALSVLAFCFLLPAMQPWEETRRSSRVVLVLDVSPSMTNWSDEISRNPQAKLKTRMDKVLDFLTSEEGRFVSRLLEKNPVFVYRVGASLDPEPGVVRTGDGTAPSSDWQRADWEAFVRYDFKQWVLNFTGPDGVGFSDEAKTILQAAAAWEADKPGDAPWATAWAKAADGLTGADELTARTTGGDKKGVGGDAKRPADPERDVKLLAAVREKVELRVDVARAITQGSAIPESITGVVNREQANMTQAVIVFSDGRSNLSSDAAVGDLTRRAKEANIPVFTVAVGSAREVVSLVISDLQAPDRTQPDEPTQVTVAVDGVGFNQNDEVEVVLELFLPGKDPKNKDAADHEMKQTIKFGAGETPHGEATFVLDAEEFAAKGVMNLVEELNPPKKGRKYQLKKGSWKVRAKVPTDPREVFRDPFHLSPVRNMEVIDKPLRVLLAASAPSREYQTLRTLLVREVEQKRAELSIFLQNDGGQKGTIVQDVPPGRLLLKFPDELDVSKDTGLGGGGEAPGTDAETARQRAKYNNLNEYDLIICFDLNWREQDDGGAFRIPNATFGKLKTWVQTYGGGFVYVAGPFYTSQLIRGDGEGGRLKPILDILPVEPDDLQASGDVLITLNTRKSPRRLKFNPPADSDLLRLDEQAASTTEGGKATAGWERFFTGTDVTPKKTETEYLSPKRGFFTYYPVKQVKPGPKPLAEFVTVDEKGQEALRPYLCVNQSGAGRSAWLGSAEIYRLRATPESGITYYDKFWLQLGRYTSAKRTSGAKARGDVLMSKEFVAGQPIRVRTKVLQSSGDPYPENELDKPKLTIEQLDQNGNVTDKFGPFDVLKPAKLGQKFEGYYQGVVNPDPAKMKVDGFRYRVNVTKADLPEPLTGEFILRSANPELDNTKPDLQALLDMASPAKPVLDVAEADAAKRAGVAARLGMTDDDLKLGRARLSFALDNPERVKVIPDLIRSRVETPQNRGTVDPLWDDEYDPATDKLTDWARYVLNPVVAYDTDGNPSYKTPALPLRAWIPAVLLLGLTLGLTWVLRTRADLTDIHVLERLATVLVGTLAIPAGLVLALPPAFSLWAQVFGELSDVAKWAVAAACLLPGLGVPVAYLLAGRHRGTTAGVILTLAMLSQALAVALCLWYGNPFPVGYAVLALAALLCSEWTLRKLFRLA